MNPKHRGYRGVYECKYVLPTSSQIVAVADKDGSVHYREFENKRVNPACLDEAHDLRLYLQPAHVESYELPDIVECELPKDWLSQSFEDAPFKDMVHVVSSRFDDGAVTFVVPIFHSGGTLADSAFPFVYSNKYLNTNTPLAFVTLRFINFMDGLCWLSWCTNPGCKDFRDKNAIAYAHFFGTDPPDYSSTTCADAGACNKLCQCGLAALSTQAGTPADLCDRLHQAGDLGMPKFLQYDPLDSQYPCFLGIAVVQWLALWSGRGWHGHRRQGAFAHL
jgi:hypothetical protein